MRESSSKAAEMNTIETVDGAADPASIGAGAGAGANENSKSRAKTAVEEMSKTKRAMNNTPLNAILHSCFDFDA